MGPRLTRLLPLFALALALAGCGEGVPAADGLEAQLKEANARSNDGTSVRREHSMRAAETRGRI